MASSDSIFSTIYSEQRWADQISKNFDNELAIDISDVPVCVCNVPKAISAVKPEAYIPQVIALGPYHHLHPELYQMERYKLATVKSFLNPTQILNFQSVVIQQLKQIELTIRACYHKYLDLDDDTLAWILAVDGLFLLDLLRDYNVDRPNDYSTARKLRHNAILYRDVMVLENQIPFILLKEIRKMLQFSSGDDTKDVELLSSLQRFCEEHSPLKLEEKSPIQPQISHLHLLDLLYNLIVNRQASKSSLRQRVGQEIVAAQMDDMEQISMEKMEEMVDLGMNNLRMGGRGPKPIQVMQKMPWKMISNLLGITTTHKKLPKNDQNPLVEEITIPSASHLSKTAGIKFFPTTGGIRDIRFVEKEATLYLPVITLNSNSEVLLRNLVAYEMAISESDLELAEYVDLMSGIIDTAEDVKLLTGKGIIKGDLSNQEVVNLFNGMNRSNGKEGSIIIEELNVYFSKKKRVKAYRFIKKHVYASWKILTVLATIVLLLLLLLQSFCDVYGCRRFFGRSP